MSEVVVTTQKMYELLLSIDKRLTEAMTVQAQHTKLLSDHESRLRSVESQEKLDSNLLLDGQWGNAPKPHEPHR